jgi:hypothetical protein
MKENVHSVVTHSSNSVQAKTTQKFLLTGLTTTVLLWSVELPDIIATYRVVTNAV